MSGSCQIHAAMGMRSYCFQMVKLELTDYVFYSIAAHTGQRNWTVVTSHVFVAFRKIGRIFAFRQSFG